MGTQSNKDADTDAVATDTIASPPPSPKTARRNAALKTGRPISKLLTYDELPAWRQDNPHIQTGYRPQSLSIARSLKSWGSIHNETVNIYTHLAPAIAILIAGSMLYNSFTSAYPRATTTDKAIFGFFLCSALLCFLLSAGYHTFENHSEALCDFTLRCDYVGILTLILGDFVSGIRVGFFCEPTLRIIYWSMILVLGIGTGIFMVIPTFHGLRYRRLRLTALIITGLSAIAPIIHGTIIFGFSQLVKQSGLAFYLGEGLIVLLGAYLYSSRTPESLAPGKFDVWGASHQLFHVLVVLATAVHFAGLHNAYEYNYTHRACGLS